ncbi:hypothetical protein GT354_00110, partial [Streptomyces sp. SID3343]|nr:hypothetical protein [Streptomyces sp. SID3343]
MKPADRIPEGGLVPHGRTPHTAALDALLSDAAQGHGGAVAVGPVGDIGTGKSALPEDAAQAAVGLRILRATGVEPEARPSFVRGSERCTPGGLAPGRPAPPAATAAPGVSRVAGRTTNAWSTALVRSKSRGRPRRSPGSRQYGSNDSGGSG